MNSKFTNLVEKLRVGEIMPQEFHLEVRRLNDFSDCLLAEINKYAELHNIFVLTNLIWTIHLFPSPKFTEILCFLLEHQPESSYMEAIVDALHDIGDKKSISSLKKVLNHYEVGDDDYNFNKKVLYALEQIRTKDAFEVIKTALSNDNSEIRETAEEILKRSSLESS